MAITTIDLVRDSTMHDIAMSMRIMAGLPVADIATPADLRLLVTSGKAEEVLNVGDQIRVKNRLYGDIIFNILGFDMEEMSDKTKLHSMTIQPNLILGVAGTATTMQFDSPEVLAASGTYKSAYSYYRADTSSSAGYRLLTAGGDYTVGGTIGSGIYANSVKDSSANIFKYGYNRWAYSGIRQWLNSSADAGAWWKSAHYGDVKPSYADTLNGFLSYFEQDFIDCLAKVKKVTAKNTATDGGSSEITEDYFFLLSRDEVCGSHENGIVEGTAYPFYVKMTDPAISGTANAGRVKKRMDSGNSYGWFLRTPSSASAHEVRRVYSDGSCDDIGKANAAYGICPACVIA